MHGNVVQWCADWYGEYDKGQCDRSDRSGHRTWPGGSGRLLSRHGVSLPFGLPPRVSDRPSERRLGLPLGPSPVWQVGTPKETPAPATKRPGARKPGGKAQFQCKAAKVKMPAPGRVQEVVLVSHRWLVQPGRLREPGGEAAAQDVHRAVTLFSQLTHHTGARGLVHSAAVHDDKVALCERAGRRESCLAPGAPPRRS